MLLNGMVAFPTPSTIPEWENISTRVAKITFSVRNEATQSDKARLANEAANAKEEQGHESDGSRHPLHGLENLSIIALGQLQFFQCPGLQSQLLIPLNELRLIFLRHL